MTDIADIVWIAITQLGEDRTYLVLLVIVYLGISRNLGVRMATYALTSVWANTFLKDAFKVPRPPPEFWKVHVEGYGFPSGHAQGNTVLWGYLTSTFPSYLAYGAAILLVLLVSYSRVALGVHSVADVVGGVCFGLLILGVGWVVENKLAGRMLKDQAKLTWLALPVSLAIISTLTSLGGDDGFRATGAMIGMLVGYMILEIKQTAEPKTSLERVTNVLVGLMLVFPFYYTLGKAAAGPIETFLTTASIGLIASLIPVATIRLTRTKKERMSTRTEGRERSP